MDENVAVGKEELEVVKLEVVKDGAKQEVVVQDAEDNAGENVQEQSPEVQFRVTFYQAVGIRRCATRPRKQ